MDSVNSTQDETESLQDISPSTSNQSNLSEESISRRKLARSQKLTERAQGTAEKPHIIVAGAIQRALQWVPHKNPVTLAVGTIEMLRTSYIPSTPTDEIRMKHEASLVVDDTNLVLSWIKYVQFARAAYATQTSDVAARAGIEQDNVLSSTWESSALRPAHFLIRHGSDIILAIRGTNNVADALTDMAAAPVEFEFGRANGCVHGGMLRAALWVVQNSASNLAHFIRKVQKENHTRKVSVTIVGHSLGGGVAALATMLLLDTHQRSWKDVDLKAVTFAPAAVVSQNVVDAYSDCISAIICENDIVPRFCCFSAKELGEVLYQAAKQHRKRMTSSLYNTRIGQISAEIANSVYFSKFTSGCGTISQYVGEAGAVIMERVKYQANQTAHRAKFAAGLTAKAAAMTTKAASSAYQHSKNTVAHAALKTKSWKNRLRWSKKVNDDDDDKQATNEGTIREDTTGEITAATLLAVETAESQRTPHHKHGESNAETHSNNKFELNNGNSEDSPILYDVAINELGGARLKFAEDLVKLLPAGNLFILKRIMPANTSLEFIDPYMDNSQDPIKRSDSNVENGMLSQPDGLQPSGSQLVNDVSTCGRPSDDNDHISDSGHMDEPAQVAVDETNQLDSDTCTGGDILPTSAQVIANAALQQDGDFLNEINESSIALDEPCSIRGYSPYPYVAYKGSATDINGVLINRSMLRDHFLASIEEALLGSLVTASRLCA